MKRCNNTEILWKRKHVSLASPELWPKLLRNWRAEEVKTPNVSIAMGWKMWRAPISRYFYFLREAAISAVDPVSRVAPSMYDSANGHVTTTSQHNDLLLCQGTSVRPSGHFTSVRNKRKAGSLVTCTPAEAKERVIKSFSTYSVVLAVLPGALLQTKLCYPQASTNEQQQHRCGSQRSIPSLRPTATRTASSSSLSP